MTVTGLLLAAGRGERIRPLSDWIAKPALPVLDIPLAARSLAGLAACCDVVWVNLSHLADDTARALEAHAPGLRTLVERPEPFGTGGTLVALRAEVAGPIVVANGDVVTDLAPADLLAYHRAAGARATVAAAPVNAGADLRIDAGRVVGFIDRRRDPGARGARYIGAAVFEPEALALLPDRRPLGMGETLLRRLADDGDLHVLLHDGYTADVGDVATYIDASARLLDGPAPPQWPAPPGEVIDAGDGPAYIGPGARVAEGTVGAGAAVLAGATVERGARVQRAVVWPGERVASTARVEGAVVARGQTVTPTARSARRAR